MSNTTTTYRCQRCGAIDRDRGINPPAPVELNCYIFETPPKPEVIKCLLTPNCTRLRGHGGRCMHEIGVRTPEWKGDVGSFDRASADPDVIFIPCPAVGCVGEFGHAGSHGPPPSPGAHIGRDDDSLIDSNHAVNGAEWLLRHRTHVTWHNERGFGCMDCEGTNDAVWLTPAAWNDRAESRDEVLEDVRRRAQGILDVVKKASEALGRGLNL